MPEMLVTSPTLPPRRVHDYDFMLSNGAVQTVTVDEKAGDTVDINEFSVRIIISPKSSFDRTKTIPGEEIVMFSRHIVSIQKREREITELTPEQQYEWSKTILSSTGSIN